MNKLKYTLSRNALNQIYLYYLLPIIEYVSLVWDGCQQHGSQHIYLHVLVCSLGLNTPQLCTTYLLSRSQGPWNSGNIHSSLCRVLVYAQHCKDIFMSNPCGGSYQDVLSWRINNTARPPLRCTHNTQVPLYYPRYPRWLQMIGDMRGSRRFCQRESNFENVFFMF